MKNLVFSPLLTLGLAFSGLVNAGTQNLIDYRKAVMSSVGAHMKALSLIAKEKGESGLQAHMAHHGNAMKNLAAITPDLFAPASNNEKESSALAKIWDPKTKKMTKDFVSELKAFKEAAAKAAELTNKNDLGQLKGAMGALGKSCKSCHDSYKRKD